MYKLLILTGCLLIGSSYAIDGRNQGAVNNLCQNLSAGCSGGDQQSCDAYKNTGCGCDSETGTCSRGNYSDNNEAKQ